MKNTFTFNLADGPRVFTFREQKKSMAVRAIVEKHAALFEELSSLEEDGTKEMPERAIRLLMSDREFFEEFMRLHLRGDHTGADWFYEADPGEVMEFLHAYSAWKKSTAEPAKPKAAKKRSTVKKSPTGPTGKKKA